MPSHKRPQVIRTTASKLIALILLMHVLAVVGLLLSILYLLWGLLKPSDAPCLRCLLLGGKRGPCDTCSPNGLDSGKPLLRTSLRSVLFSFVGLAAASVLSISAIYGEFTIGNYVYHTLWHNRGSVSLSAPHTYTVGEQFPLDISLNSSSSHINAAEIDISFNPSVIRAQRISVADSVLDIFVINSFDNNSGTVRLVAGTPSPGVTGNILHLATVYFVGITSGVADVSVSSQSKVLLNDSKGTNILHVLPTTRYRIISP